MNEDLEIIDSLKYKTGRSLRRLYLEDIFSYEQGYTIDKNRNIIGLNLNDCGLIGGGIIGRLKYLTHLDLSDNRIVSLRFLENLKQLSYLYLTNNQVKDISELGSLKQLSRLYLNANPIEDYTPLKDLQSLTHLYLNSNRITDFSFLEDMSGLMVLNLSGCKLKNLHFLLNLKNLTHLYLGDNQIAEIDFLKDFTHLTRLDLRNNRIRRLPPEIIDSNMDIYWTDVDKDGILLKNNPIEPPPIEILKKGSHDIKIYLKSVFGKNQALNEVKVLLVGNGNSGKTSLMKRLCGEPFDRNEPQTHGINIQPREIKIKNESIKIHFWDFGGQEILHATHRFFLSRRSLYILVLDARGEEKPEYWLQHIESFGGDSPVLVVMNKIDENQNFDVNRLFLQSKYPNIKGFYRVSCATNKGIGCFSKNLINALKEVEMCKIRWPSAWFVVKTYLENMGKPFINYDEYRSLCRQENITDPSTQNTLIGFLHDLGVILHFKDIKLLDTNVLEPKWVTQAVYKIINSQLIKERDGILDLDSLEEILHKQKKTDYYYPPERFNYIIELMKKFELCYQIDEQSALIPDQLEIQEKRINFDYRSSLKFAFSYDFLPTSIMQRFIVKVHQDIKGDLRWRTGVVLENKSYNSTAVIKSDNEAKIIYIWVNGSQKWHYFSAISYILKMINQSFEKLVVNERVPLPDNPDITVSYSHLIRLEEMEQEYYIPEGADKKYHIKTLLEGIEKKGTDEKEIAKKVQEIFNVNIENIFGPATIGQQIKKEYRK